MRNLCSKKEKVSVKTKGKEKEEIAVFWNLLKRYLHIIMQVSL